MAEPYYQDDQVTLHLGDALDVARELPGGAADCIVTSPPYFGLRDYGTDGQYGLESSPTEYVETMRALFAELRRVLADDGTLWLNIGDSYSGNPAGNKAGSDGGTSINRCRESWHSGALDARRNGTARAVFDRPAKSLLGIPWRVAFALQDDGWILRNDIIWSKKNSMPESVRDRLSNRYEHIFMFSKSRSYWFDLDAIRQPLSAVSINRYRYGFNPEFGDYKARLKTDDGANFVAHPDGGNPGDVWEMPTTPFKGAHFACFPVQLPQRCILAGCKPGGTVLDPFSGSGTTGLAAQRTGRHYIGIDLNPEYLGLSLRTRLGQSAIDFEEGA